MAIDYGNEASELLMQFVGYHRSIKMHSPKTTEGYYVDLRQFFRYYKRQHRLVDPQIPFDEIPIYDVDIEMANAVTMTDIYGFRTWLDLEFAKEHPELPEDERHLSANTIHRKTSSIRSFYTVISQKLHLTAHNPTLDLETPKKRKALPVVMQDNETYRLLHAISGTHEVRDRCIIVILLTCALRVSELCNLNISDVYDDSLKIFKAKGNKQRVVYLNDAAKIAINRWLEERPKYLTEETKNTPSLFLSQKHSRISVDAVENMMNKTCLKAGLSSEYTPHKLRHTSATLMLKNGVDIRVISEVLGHSQLSTTQIYTHVANDDLKVASKVLDKYL